VEAPSAGSHRHFIRCRNTGNATAGVPYGDYEIMGAYEDYRELIDFLNTREPEERERKKHRLAMDCYAASD
jgi:hypothetical protein